MAKKPFVPQFSIRPSSIGAFEDLELDFGDEVDLDFLEEGGTPAFSLDDDSDIDIIGMVDEALEQRTLVPNDTRFDDSSMPKAKNFVEWTTGRQYLDATPYLEQMLIGVKLFGEFCPRCSNVEWMEIENHEPSEGITGLLKNVTLLEHGKCPKCGARRAELMLTKELKFYNELAVNAGQRCLVGSMPVLTEKGLMPIQHMFVGNEVPGFHKAYGHKAHSGGRLQDVKQIFIARPEMVTCVVLSNGMFFEATSDHPFRTSKGFTQVKNVEAGMKVPLYVGTNTWGKIKSPLSIFDAGLSTKQAALGYLIQNSVELPDSTHRIYSAADVDTLHMVTSILCNAGLVPEVEACKGTEGYYIVWDAKAKPKIGTVQLEIIDVHATDVQVTYDLLMDGLPQFLCNGVLQHNSGKSVVTAMLSTYITHRILKSQSPTAILGIESTTILHGTFVALTQKQAVDTLWSPYFQYLQQAPWFQKYHALVRKQERRYGIEVMKIRDTFVLYSHRNLIIYPAGPDGRILRGRTRIIGAIDEVAFFDNDADSKKIKINAGAVYSALDRSLSTVRAEEMRQLEAGYDDAFTGYMFNISSPVHARDKINELLRLSVGSDKILGVHAPTWKMNPKMPRDSPFLVEAFRRDPIGAARDYGAEAPMSANPFISQRAGVQAALRTLGKNLCVITQHIHRHKDGTRERYGSLVKAAPSKHASIMAIDAGHTNNSFSIVTGHRTEDGVIHVDCLAEVIPLPGIPLNYTLIFDELLIPLAKARQVKVLLADQWNSIKLLSDAKLEENCPIEEARKYSLKYQDLWTVKVLFDVEKPRITLPRMTKCKSVEETLHYDAEEYPRCFEGLSAEHLVMQILTVQDTGRSVVKNTGATDDSFRAMALMVWGFESGEFDEILRDAVIEAPVNRDPARLGVLAGRLNTGVTMTKSLPSPNVSAVVRHRSK